MRHLVTQVEQAGLPDQVGGNVALIRVRDLLRIEFRLPEGAERYEQFGQLVEISILSGGDQDNLRFFFQECAIRFDTIIQQIGGEHIDFVGGQHQRGPARRAVQKVSDLFVLVGWPGRDIHQPQDHVHALQRLLGLLVEELPQLVARAVDAGRIHEDQLVGISCQNPQLSFARGLRLGGDRCDLLSQQCIDQRGLANVWSPQYGNKTRTEIVHGILSYTRIVGLTYSRWICGRNAGRW